MEKFTDTNSLRNGRLWFVLLVPILCLLTAVGAQAATLNVQGVNKLGSSTAINEYRWLIEEDATYHVQRTPAGEVALETNPYGVYGPKVDPNWHHEDASGNPYPLSLSFHRSYFPVVAKGDDATALPPVCTSAGVPFPCLSPDKHYFVSVLPKAAGTYSIGGAQFKGSDTGAVSVYLNQLPIPTAQITIFVFRDNQSINSAPDAPEQGLGGFQILVEDAGGRYGASAGQQSQDAFGNPLGTVYVRTCDEFGQADSDPTTNYGCLDGEGMPIPVLDGGNPVVEPLITGPDGQITIKNLAPGKYGIMAVPPIGSNWQQTSTIEGTKVIDAWVKANEPAFFAEFGPPGYHVFIGFVKPFDCFNSPGTTPEFCLDPDGNSIIGSGPHTISGNVVNLHLSRPPGTAFYTGGPYPHTTPWVGLNSNVGLAGASNGIYATRTNDGNFEITGVPPGDYQLVVWDDNMDLVFAFQNVTVTDASVDLNEVGAFQWFTRLENRVFNDLNGNGVWNWGEPGLANEPGILEQAVNLRWRDGTLYLSAPTDGEGSVPFDEVFPFFAWQVAEVDFLRFKATGVTVTVDDGGPVPFGTPWAFDDQLNPQPQGNPTDPTSLTTPFFRVEQGPVLTEGFQGFLGQTSVMQWGKKAYGPGENGGISGLVYYAVTRAEDDPRYAAVEPWEPGIPRVQVNLYKDADGDGEVDDIDDPANGIQYADVDNYPYDWSTGNPAVGKGPEDVDYNGNDTFEQGDAIQVTWTDSWDDNLPTNCQYGVNATIPGEAPYTFRGQPTDCFDGMRVWNQVRPGVFDGGYAFNDIPMGVYIVEVKLPPGYELVKEEDRNVDFGDNYIPSPGLLPPVCTNYDDTDGNGTPGRLVPAELSLFPGEPVGSGFGGTDRPLCDRKQIYLSNGANAAADFFLFTEVPVAGHIFGGILDDTANEFDPNSPQFGEKFAPPFLPISIQDWTGREIGRTYSDEYGRFNVLVPSTYTTNLPAPSGMSPNMLTTCMNHPGPIPNPAGGSPIEDPLFNPQYSTFCYTFQYMPGSTTYLDTPVVPTAAFAGPDQFPLDCEFPAGTPRIKSVSVNGGGPYIPNGDGGQTIVIESMGSVAVPNPAYDGVGGTQSERIQRDYGFGSSGSAQLVDAAGNAYPLIVDPADWTNAAITATVPSGLPSGANGALQLTVTRNDTNRTTITGLTVQVGLRSGANVVRVPGNFATIQAAIDAPSTQANSLILCMGPGTYNEMVIMWKPVQLQAWGPGVVTINAVNTPAEKLQLWRQKTEQLVTGGLVDLLPGQAGGFGGIEPGTLFTEEGAGVIVLAKDTGPRRFRLARNRGARIDGFTIRGASSGGGIIANGYADYMEISNNFIKNNSGFYGGGVRLGHPELTDPATETYVNANNYNIAIDHNYISQNGGQGGAGGGVSLCTGSNNYDVIANWICGNFTLANGGGIGHLGLSNNGMIADNKILFNEQFNQGQTFNGGGIFIGGQPPLAVGALSPGSGNVDVISNVIQGNGAGAGDGGGIRLSQVNGQDVSGLPGSWYGVDIFNNMIVNNVAGLAGGGISLSEVAKARIVHNVVANNDSTATAANAFTAGSFQSNPQPAGIVARAHSQPLSTAVVTECAGSTNQYCDADNPNPLLQDNIIWHNRSFYFAADFTDPNLPVYMLFPDLNGGQTPVYDDLGVLGTATPQFLDPRFNILTDRTEDAPGFIYLANNQDAENTAPPADPAFVFGYENGGRGATVNPGEITTNLIPTAAFDEGGNFIRVQYGPLTIGNSDYHITAASTAVDADTRANPPARPGGILQLLEDIDDEPRPAGAGGPDFGADELQ